MLTSALLLLFASSGVQPAFLHERAPRRIRLLAEELPPAPPPAELPSYAGWTRAQLQQEYVRLKDSRPSLGAPIALLSSGAAVLAVSLNLLLLGILASSGVNSASLPFVAVFGIIGTGGATMGVIGGILLARIAPERKPYSAQMDEVQRLLKEGEDQPADQRQYVPDEPPIIGPPPQGPPPLPLPPYSPQAAVHLPLLFARF